MSRFYCVCILFEGGVTEEDGKPWVRSLVARSTHEDRIWRTDGQVTVARPVMGNITDVALLLLLPRQNIIEVIGWARGYLPQHLFRPLPSAIVCGVETGSKFSSVTSIKLQILNCRRDGPFWLSVSFNNLFSRHHWFLDPHFLYFITGSYGELLQNGNK